MGAAPFRNWSTGKTPEEAFSNVVANMRQQVGYGGYSGTIAEKRSFKLLTPPPGVAALDFAKWVVKSEPSSSGLSKDVPAQYVRPVLEAAEISDNKYGPAAAVEVKGEELKALQARKTQNYPIPEGHRVFFFFGWAPE